MKLSTKILLDRVIARPLATLVNVLVWPLGKILNRDHAADPDKVKNIVVLKFIGMGSILRSTPMLKALKSKYPGSRLHFITRSSNKQLLKRLETIDQPMYVEDSNLLLLFMYTIKTLVQCWIIRVDLFFDLEVYSGFSTLLATASLARNRYGFYRFSAMFRMQLHTHLVYFNDSKNIAEIYMQLAAACNAWSDDFKLVEPAISDKEVHELEEFIDQPIGELTDNAVIINPNASELMYERRWPLSYFAALVNHLTENSKLTFYIVGNKQERDYCNMLVNVLSREAQSKTTNTAGGISFGAALALIKRAKLMITNDSGLYHLSLSMGTPTLSLWGPVSPTHYANYHYCINEFAYNEFTYCSPCVHRVDRPPCAGNNICMKSIKPSTVYSKACNLLKIPQLENEPELNAAYYSEYDPKVDITVMRPDNKLIKY
ncbi:MAG: hypothetical protein GF398_07145 [Chitinivibrionales bacterium]|nr:hypothetical protein [Chitinivibrionales bacterium]